MTFDEYMLLALRTAGPKCRGSLEYSMGGVGGEAGEYIDVVKKHLFHGKPLAESRAKARGELGDLLWGIAQAADAWGLSMSEIARGNIDKLRTRYPAGFSAERANDPARDLPVKCAGDGVWGCCLPEKHAGMHVAATRDGGSGEF